MPHPLHPYISGFGKDLRWVCGRHNVDHFHLERSYVQSRKETLHGRHVEWCMRSIAAVDKSTQKFGVRITLIISVNWLHL